MSRRSSAWMKVSSSGSGGYRGSFSFGNISITWRSAPVITFQIRRTTSLRNCQVALVRRDDPLPVPLVHVRRVVVVEEVVLAHRAHVGHQPLAHLHPELLQRHPLPLRRRLHDLRLDRMIETETAREIDRRARPVAVEIVVDAALPAHDERHLHPDQVELPAQPVLDVPLRRRDGDLRLLRVQQRPVVLRQDLLDFLVGADARSCQVGLLVRHTSIPRPGAAFASKLRLPRESTCKHRSPDGRRDGDCPSRLLESDETAA